MFRPDVVALFRALAQQPIHSAIRFIADALPPSCRCMRFVLAQLDGSGGMAGQPALCVEKDKNRCARCGAQRSAELKMKVCAGCKTVLYCSKQCQAEDWEGHKGLCHRLSEAPSAPKAAQQVAESPPVGVSTLASGVPNFAAAAPSIAPAAAAAAVAASSSACTPAAEAAAPFAALSRRVGSLNVDGK
jgi:hypothetical protein